MNENALTNEINVKDQINRCTLSTMSGRESQVSHLKHGQLAISYDSIRFHEHPIPANRRFSLPLNLTSRHNFIKILYFSLSFPMMRGRNTQHRPFELKSLFVDSEKIEDNILILGNLTTMLAVKQLICFHYFNLVGSNSEKGKR